jgi:hypothetical protein
MVCREIMVVCSQIHTKYVNMLWEEHRIFVVLNLVVPSLLYNGHRVFSEGKVRPGRDADPSPPSNAEVKNRVELYLYSP